MNDLDWIKYYPSKMFVDTVGMTAHAERAHRRLFDYLLINDGPPPADDETLRQISATSPQDWGRTKQELIRKGWVQVGESFLHRGAVKTLNESKETYVANHNRTCRANGLPPMSLSKPHPESGVLSVIQAVATDVTSNVTMDVTKGVTRTQEQEQGQPQKALTKLTIPKGLDRGSGGKSPPEPESDILCEAARERLAQDIVWNRWGWHYDNCKLLPGDLIPASLRTVLKEFIGLVTEAQVRSAWVEAAKRTHQAVVDGMEIKASRGAYVVGIFKEELRKVRGNV
jgi:hypothetical protein